MLINTGALRGSSARLLLLATGVFIGLAFLFWSAGTNVQADTPAESYIVELKEAVTTDEVLAEEAKVDLVKNILSLGKKDERGLPPLIKKVRTKALDTTQKYHHVLNGFAADLSPAELESIKKDPRVVGVFPDSAIEPQGQPNNTGLRRIGGGIYNEGLGAPLRIAVLDTGVMNSHPDLTGVVAGGTSCIPSEPNSHHTDVNGHGTQIAGIIAARDNNFGMMGFLPEAKIISVKVLKNDGIGSVSSLICGLDYVAANSHLNGGSIRVANLSIGYDLGHTSDNNCGYTIYDPLHKAACRARDAGVTLVVAAGNSYLGMNVATWSPAGYDDAVITVGAMADTDGKKGGLGPNSSNGEEDDSKRSSSNYGSIVDIIAPGEEINTTQNTGGYGLFSGTSAATPFVTASAALYLYQHPGSSWTQVRDGLKAMSDPVDTSLVYPSAFTQPVLWIRSMVD